MYIDKKLKRVAKVTMTSEVLTAAEKLPKIKTSKMIKTITDQTARVRYLLFILIPQKRGRSFVSPEEILRDSLEVKGS